LSKLIILDLVVSGRMIPFKIHSFTLRRIYFKNQKLFSSPKILNVTFTVGNEVFLNVLDFCNKIASQRMSLQKEMEKPLKF